MREQPELIYGQMRFPGKIDGDYELHSGLMLFSFHKVLRKPIQLPVASCQLQRFYIATILNIAYILSEWYMFRRWYSLIVLFFIIIHPHFSNSTCISVNGTNKG